MKNRKALVKNAKITHLELKEFILEVVNAPDRQVDGSDDQLAQKYRHFFPTRDRDIQLIAETFSRLRDPNRPQSNGSVFQKQAREMTCRAIGSLRNRLRAVWLAGFDDVAEWRVWVLQREAHWSTNLEDQRSRDLYPPSPDTPIELAIGWVRKNLLTLRVCRNPECSRPFFVAHRAQQRFCLECVSASQRAHKRRWWRKKKRLREEPGMKAGARIIRRKRSGGSNRDSERKLKEFVHHVVNAREGSIDYILRVYADAGFLPSRTISTQAFDALKAHVGIGKHIRADELIPQIHQEKRQALNKLRDGLRDIWSADDDYTAQWRLFTLQNKISADPVTYKSESQPSPPADLLVHQAFRFLRQNLRFLRTCKNPTCKTLPFFIADKARQAYCSDLCGRWGQTKAKAHWWKVEGPGWRKRRRQQQTKERRMPRKTR